MQPGSEDQSPEKTDVVDTFDGWVPLITFFSATSSLFPVAVYCEQQAQNGKFKVNTVALVDTLPSYLTGMSVDPCNVNQLRHSNPQGIKSGSPGHAIILAGTCRLDNCVAIVLRMCEAISGVS